MYKILLFILVMLFPVSAQARNISDTTDNVTEKSMFNPGDFFWNTPTKVSAITITVNLTTQMVYVKNGDTLIGVSNISSGRPGYDTPVGSFTILGKEENHFSKHYQAAMPFTMWVTNDGVALHSGGTPGHPSSHGCVHLPLAFAQLLYQVVKSGTVVTISHDAPETSLVLDLP